MNAKNKRRANPWERNSGLLAVVSLAALLTPQIIARALPTGVGMGEVFGVAALGMVILFLTFIAYRLIAQLTPRRAASQLVSTHIGQGVGVLVVSARFVAYSLLVVLGTGLIVNVASTFWDFEAYRQWVLIVLIVVLSIPVLFGRSVSWRLIIGGAFLAAIALGTVLGWALVLETFNGIDYEASNQARLDALSNLRIEQTKWPFMEAILGSIFPAGVLIVMSERVMTRPEYRRVSPRLLGKLFALLLLTVAITLYFVALLRMPGLRLSVVTLSMAYAFWGNIGQAIIAVCYVAGGAAGVLSAYSRLPHLIRELAVDRFLPDRMADARSSGPRIVVVILVALLASALASVLTTTQAGAMVFIFDTFVIAFALYLSMAARATGIVREAVEKDVRVQAIRTKWIFRAMATGTIFVLIGIAVVNYMWALAAVSSLLLPAAVLLFFRRGRVKIGRSLEIDDLQAGRKLPARVHGLVYVSDTLDVPLLKTVTYARSMRLTTLTAITINQDSEVTKRLRADWNASALPVSLTVLGTPSRASVNQIVTYVRDLRALHPADIVVVFLPRVISTGWWKRIFIRHTTPKLISELRFEAGVVLCEVPYVLTEDE